MEKQVNNINIFIESEIDVDYDINENYFLLETFSLQTIILLNERILIFQFGKKKNKKSQDIESPIGMKIHTRLLFQFWSYK